MAKTRRLKKFLLIGLAGLVLLLIAAVVLIPLMVDVNSYRPKIESLAQEKLGRQVELGELGLTVFPLLAVTIDGLSVADDGEGELLTAERVSLGAQLGPLLSGKVAIGRVTVEEPRVTLRRLASGEWEIAELLRGGETGEGGGRVSIEGIRIKGGQVLVEDASVSPGRIVRHELKDLDLELNGLDRSEGPFDVEFSALLPSISSDTRVAWSGEIGRDLTAEGELQLAAFELSALAAHASSMGGRDLSALSGRIDADLEVDRNADGALAIAGTTAASGLVLPREDASPLSLPDFELALDLDAGADGRIALDRFDLELGDMTLSATGSLETKGDERTLTLEMPETKLQIDDLQRLAGQAGVKLPLAAVAGKAVRVGGKLRAVANMKNGFDLKRLDLDGLTVDGLRLAVVRGKDGRFDFQGDGGESAKAKSSTGGGLELAARNIRISDLSVRFEDRGLNGEAVVTELTDVEVTIDKWLPGKTTPVRVAGRFAGGKASLDGSVGPIAKNRLPVDLHAKLEDIEVDAVAPYLAHYAGLNADRGRLQLDSRLRGDKATEISLKGRLALEKARVTLEGRDPLTLDLTVDHDLSLEKGGDRIRLRELTLGLPGGPVGFDGLIDLPEGGSPSFDVGTRGSQRLTTDDLRYLIGLLGAETGVTLDAGEPLVLDARLKKRGTKFEVSGSAKLRKLIVQHALLGDTPLRVARADVRLSGQKIQLSELLLQLGESDLNGSLSLEGFDQHRVRFDLRSKKADLDELFAFAGRTGEGDAAQAKAANGDDALGRTRADGRLRVEHATLKDVEMTNFDAKLSLADRRLQLKPAKLALYGGRASASITADLGATPISYQMSGDLSSVQVRELLQAGLGYGDLSGVGGGTLSLAGEAGPPELAIGAVTGDGKLELKDGVLGGLNMLEVLKEAQVFGERSIAELGARLSEEGTSFERLDADYTLSGGVLRLERLFTETPDAKVTAKGPVYLIGQRVNLQVVVTFQPELSQKMKDEGSRAAKYFWSDRDNGVRIPLKIVGPLAEPKGVIDWEGAIAQYAKGELGRKLGGALGGLLGGGQGSSAPSDSGTEATTPNETKRETSTQAPPSSSSSGAVSVELRRVRTGGNFLTPDVKVEAVLSGTDIAGALIVVKDDKGREVHRDERAFQSQVDAHYAGGADRRRATTIEVSWKLDGKRVAGKRGLKVSVTPLTRSGAKGATVTKAVKAKKLF